MTGIPFQVYSKNEPRDFQRRALNAGARRAEFAFLFPPGLGKTYVTLANAAYLARSGSINGLLVLAPKGVHLQWVKDQLPLHWPTDLPYEARVWSSDIVDHSPAYLDLMGWVCSPSKDKVHILAINIDALRLKRVILLAKKFLMLRWAMIVSDESTDIKSPSSLRGRRARRLARMAKYRRILSATPMEKPLDLYAQFDFLDWQIIGARTYQDMKLTYAEWEKVPLGDPADPETRWFLKLLQYVNLDKLAKRIAPYSYRVDEKENGQPPLTYKVWRFTLPKALRSKYDELKEEKFLTIDGVDIDGSLAITRQLRLQQITCGYVPVPLGEVQMKNGEPTGEPTLFLEGGAARIEALAECLAYYPDRPTLIFCRYKLDEQRIADLLSETPLRWAIYGGSAARRAQVKADFEQGKLDIFVANAATAARGLDGLQRATLVIHYSSYFKLETFIQANYRAQRIGGTGTTLVVELVADDTVDEDILHNRKVKQETIDPILAAIQAHHGE